jgi:hypothetical protein
LRITASSEPRVPAAWGEVYLARGHPHIITVYEIGCEPVRSANGTTRPELVNYIAMELVAGDTLGEITGLK